MKSNFQMKVQSRIETLSSLLTSLNIQKQKQWINDPDKMNIHQSEGITQIKLQNTYRYLGL